METDFGAVSPGAVNRDCDPALVCNGAPTTVGRARGLGLAGAAFAFLSLLGFQ